ncbi:hypothetical protein BJF79_48570 [Actinomadura sp. CNU-125]|nr:hypothetical protein BJF79_48570 [Actinomadura sp. CNU-125]
MAQRLAATGTAVVIAGPAGRGPSRSSAGADTVDRDGVAELPVSASGGDRRPPAARSTGGSDT